MTHSIEHIVKPEEAVTLHGLFLERVRRTPDAVAYKFHADDTWQDLTWAQVREGVARWQAALAAEKLSPGDRVGLMLRNCPQWIMFDQAAMSLGLVVVPFYTVDRPDNVAYIAQDAGVKVFLFESAEQWSSLKKVRGQMPCVTRFVSLDRIEDRDEPSLICAGSFLPAKARLQESQASDRHALATIIYTSGTTGKPKGVMLSHWNIVYNAYAGLLVLPVGAGDIKLSFLPLSHTFERTVGYYISVMAGATVAFARSVQLLSEDLLTIRPTVLICVPRIYERIYKAVYAKLEEATPSQRRLFELTKKTGWTKFEYEQGRGKWHPALLLWPVLKRMVADKVMVRLGGRLRFSISGGAALSPEISRFFISMGLPLLQGYGMTETSPVVSCNRMNNNFPASVGPALEGIEVKIGGQDALLVKGPCNMLGYWNNSEATAQMVSEDGWLNTGDTARISETGHIYITGRLKDIIVMSTGEKIPPADMALSILGDRLFDQVLICGEGKPYLIALAVMNPELWQSFVKAAGIDSVTGHQAEKLALQLIAAQIKDFPGYAKVYRVLFVDEPFSIENGLMTPTLKIKSAEVLRRYAGEIEKLYEGH